MKTVTLLKKHEVRIGNIVGMDALNVFPPNFIAGIHPTVLMEVNSDNFDPIPLFCGVEVTESWLDKLGFTKSNELWYERVVDLYTICYRLEDGKIELQVIDDGEEANCRTDLLYLPKEAKFIHQLQNIYFDLFGEELPIEVTANGKA